MFTTINFASACRALAVVLLVSQMTFQLAAQNQTNQAAAQSPQQRQTSDRNTSTQIDLNLSPDEQPNKGRQSLNTFVAATLAVNTEAAAELSQLVADKTDSSEVGRFAQQTAKQLQEQAQQLGKFASVETSPQTSQQIETPHQRVGGQPGEQDPDLSATAEDIGQEIRDELRERREQSPNVASAQRRGGEVQESRRDRVVQRNLEQNEGRERGLSRDGIGRDRGENRNRVVLPAIRENLPQILELAGEAMEEGIDNDVQPGSRIELVVAIAEETLSAKQQELARYDDEAYEQAYLGMIVDAGLEIEAAANAASPMVSGKLRVALEEVQQTAANVKKQARKLMTNDTELAQRNSKASQSAVPAGPAYQSGQGQQ